MKHKTKIRTTMLRITQFTKIIKATSKMSSILPEIPSIWTRIFQEPQVWALISTRYRLIPSQEWYRIRVPKTRVGRVQEINQTKKSKWAVWVLQTWSRLKGQQLDFSKLRVKHLVWAVALISVESRLRVEIKDKTTQIAVADIATRNSLAPFPWAKLEATSNRL